jgi:hypothetical protein
MPDLPKMLSTAHDVKYRFDDLLFRAKVQDSGEARISATICLTIAEQFAAVLCLVEGGHSSHAPIIVRSMLEGLAELLNLVNDSNYLNQMKFDNARSDVILFEEYSTDPEMQEDAEAIATLAEWKAKAQPIRDMLAARGFQKQGVIEKFKNANILQSYVAYRVLCSYAHNQLTTLIARHAGNLELLYHNDAPPETTASILTIAVSILCQSVNTMHKFTDIPAEELDKAIKVADEIWAKAR